MKKKVKKSLKIGGIIFVLILIIGLIYNFGFKESMIGSAGNTLEDQTKIINCLGTTCELTSPYFGGLTSGTKVTQDNDFGLTNLGSNQDYSICGDNDGKVSISNSYTSNGKLILTSSGSGSRACSGNFIKAQMTLPPGVLKITCDLSATDNRDWGASSYCSGIISASVTSKGAPPNFQIDGGTKTNILTKEIILDKETNVNIKIGGSQGQGNSYSTKVILEFTPLTEQNPVEEPKEEDIPKPKGFSFYLTAIKDFLKDLFSGIFTKQSFIGSQEVEPNTEETYSISLNAPIPDSDWSDGIYEIQWANYGLFDSNGDLINEGKWERVYGKYEKEVTLTTPSTPGDYSLVALITYYNMTYDYDTKNWDAGEEKIINKEAINLKNKRKVTEPEIPISSGFTNLLNRFWDWLKGWFN